MKSNVRLDGVFLREGEQVGIVDADTGSKSLDILEDERQFDASDVEHKVKSPDSNRKILEELKKYALEHEERYDRFPKTLIFAVNDLPHSSHCDQLVDLARDTFGRGDSFVQNITGSPAVDTCDSKTCEEITIFEIDYRRSSRASENGHNLLKALVGARGLEPRTSCL